jgi:hypothetical protein
MSQVVSGTTTPVTPDGLPTMATTVVSAILTATSFLNNGSSSDDVIGMVPLIEIEISCGPELLLVPIIPTPQIRLQKAIFNAKIKPNLLFVGKFEE